MKKIILTVIFLISITSIYAKRVGVYCFFENSGIQLYEDRNIKSCIVCEDNIMKITIHNKTSKILYIDKANSFIYINNQTSPLFSNSVYSSEVIDTSGAALNLGGAARALGINGGLGAIMGATTIGGSSSSSNTTTTYEQRILAVAPYATEVICSCSVEFNPLIIDRGEEGGFVNIRIGRNGKFIDPRTGRSQNFEIGLSRRYSQETTPFNMKFVATYSLDETFEDKQLITTEHYISDVVIDNKRGVKKTNIYLPYCAPYINNGQECYKFRTGADPLGAIAAVVTGVVVIAGSVAMVVVALV